MKTRYEDKIKMALEMQCGGISASETLKQKIDSEIRMQGKIVPISLPDGQEVSMKKSGQGMNILSGGSTARKPKNLVCTATSGTAMITASSTRKNAWATTGIKSWLFIWRMYE